MIAFGQPGQGGQGKEVLLLFNQKDGLIDNASFRRRQVLQRFCKGSEIELWSRLLGRRGGLRLRERVDERLADAEERALEKKPSLRGESSKRSPQRLRPSRLSS